MTANAQKVERAGTVELDASVDGVEMYAYMAPGCCGARCFYGLNKGTPAQVVTGIITSGISGCIMFLTDAYSNGKQAREFAEFVNTELKTHGCSAVVSEGIPNKYTGKIIYGVVFCYDINKLQNWLNDRKKAAGEPTWEKPANWFTKTDAVHMDSVFYQYGGRPKPKASVNLPSWLTEAKEPGKE